MQPEESRYDRGLCRMRAIFGAEMESALEALAASSPDLARCLVEMSRRARSSRPFPFPGRWRLIDLREPVPKDGDGVGGADTETSHQQVG